MLYVHQYPDWTHFRFNESAVMNTLGNIRKKQGRLAGIAEICENSQLEAEVITGEICSNFAIDGISLNPDEILEDVSRRSKASRNFVINSLGAIQNANSALTLERIFNWHSALSKKNTFKLRTKEGIVSENKYPREIVFTGPNPENIPASMEKFIQWFEASPLDGVVKAAIAQFWFLTLRPFDEANGKLARMITAMQLIRSSDSSHFLYSISSQIFKHREEYFTILNKTQRSSGDITEWILWFLQMLNNAINEGLQVISADVEKIKFLQKFSAAGLSIREKSLAEAALSGNLPATFSAKEVAQLLDASHDTALREIQSLISKGIFKTNGKGGRSQKYSLSSF